jgi:uncharacterized membrane protein YGL010W
MTSLIERLTQYASYHRDRRNIATHLVGIPAIVVGIEALLGRPSVLVGGLPVSPALVATIAAGGFYLGLDRLYGAMMAALLAAAFYGGARMAAQSTGTWLVTSGALFVGGWIVQFVGHAFEGRKPAFADDLVGLLVGPLFVVAEVGFALGLGDDVRRAIEHSAGPTRTGTPSRPSPASR